MAVLIFDLDGTLIDSAPDIHAAANAVLAEAGLAPLPFETVRGFIGRGVPHLVACLLDASGRDPAGPQHPDMVRAFNARYEDAVTLTRLFPGVRETLGLLARDHRLAICTNKPIAPTRAVLRHFGLDPLFDPVIGGDSLPQRKPAPEPLLLAQAGAGGGPVLFIGDSEVDAETAARAGLPFALFTEGYRKTPVSALPHQASFSQFATLPGIVADILG